MIDNARMDDAEKICQIYNHYVENSCITFEESPVSVEEMKDRIQNVTASLPWLVFRENNTILGYAYATAWKGRCAYRFSVETTVYLDQKARGRGLGKHLYTELLERLKTKGIHTAIGGISIPNDASIKLHESLGFTKVAQFREVGYKMERWIDVGYWQKNLED